LKRTGKATSLQFSVPTSEPVGLLFYMEDARVSLLFKKKKVIGWSGQKVVSRPETLGAGVLL